MELGVVLLLCLFILCITRAAERPFAVLGMQIGRGAAMSLLLLAANACVLQPFAEFSINPASLLICLYTGLSSGKRMSTCRLLQAAALAVLAGACMTALQYLHISGRVALSEPGLFLALCAVPFVLLMHKAPNAALLLSTLAPLFMNMFDAGMDLYAFGYAQVRLGSPAAFDAQVAGMLLSGVMLSLFSKRAASAGMDARRVF